MASDPPRKEGNVRFVIITFKALYELDIYDIVFFKLFIFICGSSASKDIFYV